MAFFASGNFSRNDHTTTAAVYELVWEMNELAWSCGQWRMPEATHKVEGFCPAVGFSSSPFLSASAAPEYELQVLNCVREDKQYGFLSGRMIVNFVGHCFPLLEGILWLLFSLSEKA